MSAIWKHASPDVRALNPRLDPARLAGQFDAAAARVADAKSEKQLQGQLEALLRRRGVKWVIRPRTDRKSTIAVGTPDILFSVPGRAGAVAWEVKMPGQHPRAEQVAAHEAMRADGWRVDVVRSYAEGLAILNALTDGEVG